MIIERRPRLRQIVGDVWKTLLLLFFWDMAVTAFYYAVPFSAPALPLTLFGTALALVLGFRDNSAYQRWWEGRILWGAMINASRSLTRQGIAFLAGSDRRSVDLRRTIVLRQIAYVHALRCSLRRQPSDAEVLRFLSPNEADEGLSRTNIANGILDGSARRIAEAQREGLIDTIQQARLESTLVDIANAQGGMSG